MGSSGLSGAAPNLAAASAYKVRTRKPANDAWFSGEVGRRAPLIATATGFEAIGAPVRPQPLRSVLERNPSLNVGLPPGAPSGLPLPS